MSKEVELGGITDLCGAATNDGWQLFPDDGANDSTPATASNAKTPLAIFIMP
eukprot:CAMPEP_0183295654 /NCGR_PEP_ID=MMETSP0160_2-20130417/3537_1 /TAXON_ID=2839 ORGANISM="Odontella Sinensis, Strain Grunow 1884" /NCGR_SAMPLE_ID=MMETSP0160_2 /ASSEMBLY_ACC=CAM_ASM_000250 /LENGTH=51 /DNA_ID=CAMNT_0025457173 /DNA_START=163 /DNA_END=314 /DNA_ORIENTATION=-